MSWTWRVIPSCMPSSRSSRPAARGRIPSRTCTTPAIRSSKPMARTDASGAVRFRASCGVRRTNYAQQIRLFSHGLGLDAGARDAILGKTAHRLYFERKTKRPTVTKGEC